MLMFSQEWNQLCSDRKDAKQSACLFTLMFYYLFIFRRTCRYSEVANQSELPWPIPRNSVEADHGCTSWIYFDNVGDNMKLTLYNMMLMSQKPCKHNNKCDLEDNLT